MIEFKKFRVIQNEYRFSAANLNKDQDKCIDISHEIHDNIFNQTKIKCKLKPGWPPKKIKIFMLMKLPFINWHCHRISLKIGIF